MTQTKHNPFALAILHLALLAPLLLPACDKTDTAEPSVTIPDGSEMTVALSLYMPRAESSDNFHPGSPLENMINIAAGDFRFMFYSPEGRFIDWLNVSTLLPDPADPYGSTYRLTGTVKGDIKQLKDFKLVMLANWKVYPQPSKDDHMSQLWNGLGPMVYDYSDYRSGMIDPSHLIPLYAVKDFGNVIFEPNRTVELGNIHALRAMAKIEIRIDHDRMLNTLLGVTLTRANRYGYKLPADCLSETDYLHDDYASGYTRNPHIPAPNQTLSDLPLSCQADGSYVIYVPEYDNTSASATPARIKLTYREQVTAASGTGYENLTDYIDFKYYTVPGQMPGVAEGEPFNILRNNWYRYTVGQTPREIDVSVDVVPYNIIDLQPGFGWDWLPDDDPEGSKDPDLAH